MCHAAFSKKQILKEGTVVSLDHLFFQL